MIAAVLELLDPLDYPRSILLAERNSRVPRSSVNRSLARQLGDQHLAAVADHGGIDMLERRRICRDTGYMHPTLVRERIAPDVGLIGIRREVEQLVDEVCCRCERRELLFGQAVVAEFQLEIGDDRD